MGKPVVVSESEYNGYPMIVFDDGFSVKKFQFGTKKAKWIISHIDKIVQFVKRHEPEWEPGEF